MKKCSGVSSETRSLKCDKCSKMFSIISVLRKHKRICNGMRFQSQIKNGNMKNDEMFKEIVEDDGLKKFECNKCDSVYEKIKSIRRHFLFKHMEKKFKCDKCSKMFPIKSRLRKHLETCNGILTVNKMKDVKRFICETCNQMFALKSDLAKHVKREHKQMFIERKEIEYIRIMNQNGKKQFQCKRCEKVFTRKSTVWQHFQLLHGEKKFKCDKCEKMFGWKSNLNRHLGECDGVLKTGQCKFKDIEYKEISNDGGKKQFQCCKCKNVYDKVKKVLHHIYRNHRELKNKCEKCNKKFLYKSGMERHVPICNQGVIYHLMNVDAEGIKKFKCAKCENVYDKKESIYSHFYSMHQGKKFKCDLCEKHFAFNSNLKRHKNSCDGSVEIKYKILQNDQGKRFQCKNCQKIFSKSSTFYSHYNKNHREKTFQCQKCNKTFVHQYILNNHMKKCTGSVNTRDAKTTYEIFIDWDAKKKYECDSCENHYENLDDFQQHFFEDHKSRNTSIRSKAMKNDSSKVNLKTDNNAQAIDEVDSLQISTDDCINYSHKENISLLEI